MYKATLSCARQVVSNSFSMLNRGCIYNYISNIYESCRITTLQSWQSSQPFPFLFPSKIKIFHNQFYSYFSWYEKPKMKLPLFSYSHNPVGTLELESWRNKLPYLLLLSSSPTVTVISLVELIDVACEQLTWRDCSLESVDLTSPASSSLSLGVSADDVGDFLFGGATTSGCSSCCVLPNFLLLTRNLSN